MKEEDKTKTGCTGEIMTEETEDNVLNGFSQVIEKKNGGQAVHRPTEEKKMKSVHAMTMEELQEMLSGIDKDLKYVRNLSVELNKQRDNLHRYIKIRRRNR